MIKRFEFPPESASESADVSRDQPGQAGYLRETFQLAVAEITKRPTMLIAAGLLAGLAVGWMLKRR